MPITPTDMEREVLEAGWYKVDQKGSHRHYKQYTLPGKLTIPFHCKDLDIKTEKSIRKQAGLL